MFNSVSIDKIWQTLRAIFSSVFSLFKNVVKHSLSCLITCILATFIRCLIRVGILTQLCTVGYLQLYVHWMWISGSIDLWYDIYLN